MINDERLNIGGNFPPLDLDELRNRATRLCEVTAELPDFPEDAEPITSQLIELGKMCAVLCADIEAERKRLKTPALERGREIDAELHAIAEPVQRLLDRIKPFLVRVLDFKGLPRLRSEHGALAILSTHPDIREWSLERVDLDALRNYLDKSAIEKAIRAYLRDHGSASQLRGVKWIERSTVKIR